MSEDASRSTPPDPSQPHSQPDAKPTTALPQSEPVELDEFGLPVKRRPVRRTYSHASEDSAKDEPAKLVHDDANVQSKPTESRPNSAPPKGPANHAEGPNDPAAPAPPKDDPSEHKEAPRTEPAASPPEKEKSAPQRNSTHGDFMAEVPLAGEGPANHFSEWSHMKLAPGNEHDAKKNDDEAAWQEMPAYAPYDVYNDDNKLVAREAPDMDEDLMQYGTLGGAGKGYTRVQLDDDAESATSMDDHTAYLFKNPGTNVQDDDEEARDPLSQMQATKDLLTEGQRIAYVGVVRLTMREMVKELESLERTKGAKKQLDFSTEAMQMWSQKMMVRLYGHMEIDSSEQIMIEQLAEHGVQPQDLTPALMQNARVKNPAAEDRASISSPRPDSVQSFPKSPPPYHEKAEDEDLPEVQTPSQLPETKSIDIDLRWTILCDLFLVLIADSVYDSRSRQLLERVGVHLDVPWIDICRFEKRVTDALEMQEAADKENWNEQEHIDNRKKLQRNRRLVMMGLATVGGGLVIGLSAGLLAPVIGAGLAAGFSTIGVAGTSSFLAGAGGAALITTSGVVSGGTIAVRASGRRTGAVKTFEYRPLHNNKRVNLILTISGWMNGKVDDVRLPFSTVDPIMGDIYSLLWEPEMLQSMGDTISILATEALTQSLQQVLGSTILVALMGALQLPIVLTKLSYLIDNPWNVSLARAELAGLILADSLIDRNLGVRPITLVGFSLGCRVIFTCLQELSKRGAHGLVQNVYMFGAPIVAKKDEYLKARAVVPGRFVNGYATNDWILGYLFRATSGGIMGVAGLAPVDVPGVENFNVTELVNGHMAYRAAMPRLLREVGWSVESDEFTEIEDPDPENHEARQRELINEIEEARKQLDKKPEKKGWSLFKRKQAEKKEWEMYDDKFKAGAENGGDAKGNVLFDVDAIRAEAAEITSQGIEVRQLESTMPPMKLETLESPLRQPDNKNNDVSNEKHDDGALMGAGSKGFTFDDDYGDHHPYSANGEGAISMTFDTGYSTPPRSSPLEQPSTASMPTWTADVSERPPLKTGSTSSIPAPVDLERNAWADDDEFGHEKELHMTFE
ncbi:hypothetical protein IWX90DRAFT_253886 [Phyllosticta citrichinensis]|uniref:DUF726-domain-containing protein n=1 Tax=Phyllosticta citrichinensis TaxID=1130410 RepID=A0ABR1XRT0_9PEZI